MAFYKVPANIKALAEHLRHPFASLDYSRSDDFVMMSPSLSKEIELHEAK